MVVYVETNFILEMGYRQAEKDFDAPSVRNELDPYGCRLIGSFEQGLNYISSTLGS